MLFYANYFLWQLYCGQDIRKKIDLLPELLSIKTCLT